MPAFSVIMLCFHMLFTFRPHYRKIRRICKAAGPGRPCQVVTEFLSGDHLKQGLHRTDRLTEQVNTVNLAKGITFVFKKTPVVFDVQHLV